MPRHGLHSALYYSLSPSQHPHVSRAEARDGGVPGQEQWIAWDHAIYANKTEIESWLHHLLQALDQISHHRRSPLFVPVLHEHLDLYQDTPEQQDQKQFKINQEGRQSCNNPHFYRFSWVSFLFVSVRKLLLILFSFCETRDQWESQWSLSINIFCPVSSLRLNSVSVSGLIIETQIFQSLLGLVIETQTFSVSVLVSSLKCSAWNRLWTHFQKN